MNVYQEMSGEQERILQILEIRVKQTTIVDERKSEPLDCAQLLPDPSDVSVRGLGCLLQGYQRFNAGALRGILVKEVMYSQMTAMKDLIFNVPKAKDIIRMIEKGTFEVACWGEPPDDSNILGGRFVLAINDCLN